MTQTHTTDVAIIGAGPVGLFAVFQLGMLKVRCHVIDALDAIGGQCAALYPEKPIYDIPAYPSIDALDLVKQLEAQAAPFAPVYHLGQQVTRLIPPPNLPPQAGGGSELLSSSQEGETLATGNWQLETSSGTIIHARAIIIAAGCGAFGPNRPPLDGLEAYEASGAVRYLVTRKDEFKGKHIVIAGGGDSAVDWANVLAPDAASLSIIHRRDNFRAMGDSLDKMNALVTAGKIEKVVPYQLAGLEGENGQLSGVIVSTLDGQKRTLKADYLLPFYGLSMDLGPIAGWGLGLEHSHITINPASCETNQAGVFAIGDIATYAGKLKLILCGFSEAAMAAHKIRNLIYPDVAYHFEYSTSKGVSA